MDEEEQLECGYCGDQIEKNNSRWNKKLYESVCDECHDHLKDDEKKGKRWI